MTSKPPANEVDFGSIDARSHAEASVFTLNLTDYPESSTAIPDLSTVALCGGGDPQSLRRQALLDWTLRDIMGVLSKIGNHNRLEFLVKNRGQLIKIGCYEQAFFESFITGFTGQLDFIDIVRLLNLADRKKLWNLGDPFSLVGPMQLYRGVGFPHVTLWKRPCWTRSKTVARFFAEREARRFDKGVPTVYGLKVPPERIIFHTNKRNEEEFFVELWPGARPRKIKLS